MLILFICTKYELLARYRIIVEICLFNVKSYYITYKPRNLILNKTLEQKRALHHKHLNVLIWGFSLDFHSCFEQTLLDIA